MTARLSILLAALAAASTASAQVHRPTPTITTEIASARVKPGASARLRLKVALPSGLHVQSNKPRDPALIPTALTLRVPPGVTVLRTTYPKPTDLAQPGRGEPLSVFSGSFTIDIDLALATSVRPGALEVPGELRYQSCTDQVCFPPSRAAVTWHLKVGDRAR
jgi:DsbC/DsbD-like thiol-disulfide interchange protein